MPRLNNKIAVVIGSARGIGLATVTEMLGEGATVYSADLREPAGVGVRAARHTHTLLDATDEHAVARFIDSVLAAAGRIDILFCNVGIHLGKPVTETSTAEFDAVFAANVKTAFLGCRAVIPAMLNQRRGSIIITSSNGGLMGRPNDPIYNASKHALVGLTKSLSVAYAQHGIRVNAINPGAIDTEMLRGAETALTDELARKASASTPAARVGDAVEVAKTVVFLASDEARFINGVALAIDGAKSAGALTPDRYSLDFDLYEDPSNAATAGVPL